MCGHVLTVVFLLEVAAVDKPVVAVVVCVENTESQEKKTVYRRESDVGDNE